MLPRWREWAGVRELSASEPSDSSLRDTVTTADCTHGQVLMNITRISRIFTRTAVSCRYTPRLRSPSTSAVWCHGGTHTDWRSLTTTTTRRAPTSHDDDADVCIEDEGEYEMIGPAENANETLHEPRRPVPKHIVRPPYATPEALQQFRAHKARNYSEGSSECLIELGSKDEQSLRAFAKFAARVLRATGERIAARVSALFLVSARGD